MSSTRSKNLHPAVVNTLMPADALLPFVASAYDLEPPLACELIRRSFNDHYGVTAGPRRYVLRVYFNGKYYIESSADFRFELDLLLFLQARGVPVSYPIPRRDGDSLGPMETPGGERWCALFSFAEGEEDWVSEADQGRQLGETVARLHGTADRFHSSHHRYQFDLKYLVEQPIALIDQFLRARRKRRKRNLAAFRPFVEDLAAQVCALPREGGPYGLIHGDLHHDNFRFTDLGQLTLFDFDQAGYGWRAYDLATCQGSLRDAAWEAFLAGYQSVRRLSAAELESIPTFRKIRSIWYLGHVLAMRWARGNAELYDDCFADEILDSFEHLRASTHSGTGQ